MKTLPPILQTAYSNLVQAHLERPAFDFEGAPFTRQLNNKTYWYANQRSAPGAPLKQKYLGPDTNEMRERIERMRAQQHSLADFRAYTSGLVAQLHAGGLKGPGRTDGPFLRALQNSGAFRLGGILVGTHAFRHYEPILGVGWSNRDRITETDDIDVASFSVALDDKVDPDLSEALTQLNLQPAPTLKRQASTSWLLPDRSYRIDFLTPSFRDTEGPAKITALNMWAQGLHYLDYLIKDPIPAVSLYMEGLLVHVPRPERYAVHKLIISQRRAAASKAKSRKDIEQAAQIMWAMADFNAHELQSAIAEADARGPKWCEALDRALKVIFQQSAQQYDFDTDTVRFDGESLGAKIQFAISEEAIEDWLGVSGISNDELMAAVLTSRSKIEAVAAQKFRTRPTAMILLTSDDMHGLD